MSSNLKEIKRVRNRAPTHPGSILKYDYLEPLSIPIKLIAERLKVSRKTMSMIVNGRAGITTDMALRLSQALKTTPDMWLNLQKEYDLWNARNSLTEWKTVESLEMLESYA